MRCAAILNSVLCGFTLLCAGSATEAARVSEAEALRAADLWMAMDTNGSWTGLTPEERAAALARLVSPQVLYLTSKDTLEERTPAGRVLAYVLKYGDSGWTVVSADDRLEPVIAFDRESRFRWDQPERNFARHYLGTTITNQWRMLDEGKGPNETHPNWAYLRSKLDEPATREQASFEPMSVSVVRWQTALWGQGTFYNDDVVAHNGGTAGIPTGCTATAMAMQMRFREWPAWGYGSHSYDDKWGSVKYSHSVNFGASSYLWNTMPLTSVTSANAEVAEIMYESGVAVEMDYEVGGSGAWPTPSRMNTHFRFRGTTEKDTGDGDYISSVLDCVIGCLPTIVSSSSHTVLVCGYRTTPAPYHYINAGWNGSSNGWYTLPIMPAGSDTTVDRTYPFSSPNNYTYVGTTSSGTRNGNFQSPFATVSQGVSNTPSEGHLWIKAGKYDGAGDTPVVFDSPVSIRACQDVATIGDNITIYVAEGEDLLRSSLPCIRILEGGRLSIY